MKLVYAYTHCINSPKSVNMFIWISTPYGIREEAKEVFKRTLGAVFLMLLVLGHVFEVDGHYNTMILVGGSMIAIPVALLILAIGRRMGLLE